jgi:hypothetical protein
MTEDCSDLKTHIVKNLGLTTIQKIARTSQEINTSSLTTDPAYLEKFFKDKNVFVYQVLETGLGTVLYKYNDQDALYVIDGDNDGIATLSFKNHLNSLNSLNSCKSILYNAAYDFDNMKKLFISTYTYLLTKQKLIEANISHLEKALQNTIALTNTNNELKIWNQHKEAMTALKNLMDPPLNQGGGSSRLAKKTLAELKEKAKSKKVPQWYKLNKAALVYALATQPKQKKSKK